MCGSTRWPAAPAGADPRTRAGTRPAWSPSAVGPRCRPSTPTRPPTPPIATTRSRPSRRSRPRAALPARASATPRPRATASRCSIPSTRSRPYASAPNGHVALTARVRLAGREPVAPRPGLRHHRAIAPGRDAASLSQSFASALRSYLNGWRRFDTRPAPPLRRRRRDPTTLLAVDQRRAGQRGQDLPGRDRRRPGLAMGPVGPGRPADQRRADLLRLLPRGVLARPLRGVHRAAAGRRRQQRPGRRPLPV